MVDINTLSLPDGEVVYSYKIHDLGNKKVFDFVQKIYSSCTSFGKKSVLVDALVYRADLDDVLTKFNCGINALEWVLTHDFDDFVLLENALDEIPSRVKFGMCMPEIQDAQNKDGVFSIIKKEKEYPVTVLVNGENYSEMFSDFDLFDEHAVEKAFEVMCSGKYIKADNDLSKLEEDLKVIFSNVEINGLVFGGDGYEVF